MMSGGRCRALVLFLGAICLGACAKAGDSTGFDPTGQDPGTVGSGSGDSGMGSTTIVTGPFINTGDATAPDPDAGKSPIDPSKLVTTDGGLGGYQLGPEITTMGKVDTGINASEEGCGTVVGIVRDFKGLGEQGGHVDFENYKGNGVSPGLVGPALSTDNKPIYTGICEANAPMAMCPFGQETSSAIAFNSWYRTTPSTNKAFLVYLVFAQNGPIATLDSQLFFPLDNAGFGNSGSGEDQNPHNFDFTTELHTKFKYVGGEIFSFQGDDDLWVFINGKLAIDLGGLHEARMAMVDLDMSAATLGLTKDKIYSFDLFHAERHQIGSHFHVDTTLTFSDCGDIPVR